MVQDLQEAALSPHRSHPPRHIQSTQLLIPPLSEYSPHQDLTYRNTIFPWNFLINGYGGVRYCSRLFIGDVLWPWALKGAGEFLKQHAFQSIFSTSQASSLSTSPSHGLLDIAVLSLSSIVRRHRLPSRLLPILSHPGSPLTSSHPSTTLVAFYSKETLSPSTCLKHKRSTRQRGECTATMIFSCCTGSGGSSQWIIDERRMLRVLCRPPIPSKDVVIQAISYAGRYFPSLPRSSHLCGHNHVCYR